MLWLKALHIIAVICWFAGLFYLPRLYVYHCQNDNPHCHQHFKVMEYKLYYYIMTPCAVLTTLFGLLLLIYGPDAYLRAGWLHAKLSLVILLLIYHIVCGIYLQRFANNRNTHSQRYYRWFNEVPSLLLIFIVILVVVKPFW